MGSAYSCACGKEELKLGTHSEVLKSRYSAEFGSKHVYVRSPSIAADNSTCSAYENTIQI